jgi:predicted deacylase
MITFSFSGQHYQTGRIIGDIEGSASGPVLMFIAGIHGNEPSGVLALQEVFDELETAQTPIHGRLIGVTGNLPALARNARFISKDLNRIWNRNFMDVFRERSGNFPGAEQPASDDAVAEHAEQVELFRLIEPFIEQDRTTYFIDLHSTSAPSVPFIAINDQLNNRSFALQFPVPTVLGIEEYLEGPLLSYLNDFGPVALAFEAGQHDDPESVKTHKSFVYQAMVTAGVLQETHSSNGHSGKSEHRLRLENLGCAHHDFFEVVFRKSISPNDGFSMKPGYKNLSHIKKDEVLARDHTGEIRSPMSGQIFMPLYQSSGEDGFFVVRRVPTWALKLSSVLRKVNFERFLTWLPGVSKSQKHPDALIVNKHVARILAKQLFHLLGYRRKQEDGKVMIFSRREIIL